MDSSTGILLLTVAALVGVAATVILLAARGRLEQPDPGARFGTSSEGMTACRACGAANPTTDATCLYCGADLPVHHRAT